MTPPNAFPLPTALALTLASVCECRHLGQHHDGGCRYCACGEFERDTRNDHLVTDVLQREAA